MKLFSEKAIVQLLAIFLGFTFFGAGMAKLYNEHSYFGWIGPVWLIERLEEYSLGLYAKFIALSQVLIGYLLLTTRFKLLGSVMMVPMILNILMVTISQQWRGTPFVLAVLFIFNLIILWHYRSFFPPLLNESLEKVKSNPTSLKSSLGHLVWLIGLSLQFLSIAISYYSLRFAFLISFACLSISILSFLVDKKINLRNLK